METPLTLLYTHNIAGALDMLPRLYTLLKRLRADADGKTYLLDLGASCDPAVWPCDVTHGRAVLMGLDAMGYDCANVRDTLTIAGRDKLAEQMMMALVHDDAPYQAGGVQFATNARADFDGLCVVMTPSGDESKRGIVHLPPLERGQVGITAITDASVAHRVVPLPPDTPPDTAIAGTVDFIRDEARYYGKRDDSR